MVDKLGNVPPAMIEAAFQMIRPLQKASGQLVLINKMDDPAFVKATLRISNGARTRFRSRAQRFGNWRTISSWTTRL
jgi:hypothetical protein